MSSNPPICMAFGLIAEICIAMDAAPLTKHAGAWELVVDDRWKLAVNGHDEPKDWHGVPVQPFMAVVEYNGWPAGVLGASGGVIAAGECANEDTFIAALEAKLAALSGSPTQ